MKKLITICAVVALMVITTSAAYAALPSDNFNDNSRNTSMWNLYEEDNSEAWLDETSARLEFRSTASADDLAALYISNNWGLLTTSDFSFKVDFHYSSTVSSSVLLGVAKDEANDVWLEAGYRDGSAYFCWDAIVGDSVIDANEKLRSSDDGILYISYDESEDELYVSDIGYWSTDAWGILPGLVDGAWGADVVGLLLGGSSGDADAALPPDVAYLDNFVVDSGTIIPEPATIILLGFGSLLFSRNRRFNKK
jgi:hypothetical protein